MKRLAFLLLLMVPGCRSKEDQKVGTLDLLQDHTFLIWTFKKRWVYVAERKQGDQTEYFEGDFSHVAVAAPSRNGMPALNESAYFDYIPYALSLDEIQDRQFQKKGWSKMRGRAVK